MAAPIGPVRLYRSKVADPAGAAVTPRPTVAPVRYYKRKYAPPIAPRIAAPAPAPAPVQAPADVPIRGRDLGISAALGAGGVVSSGLALFGPDSTPDRYVEPEAAPASSGRYGSFQAEGYRPRVVGSPGIKTALNEELDTLREEYSPEFQSDLEARRAETEASADAPILDRAGMFVRHSLGSPARAANTIAEGAGNVIPTMLGGRIIGGAAKARTTAQVLGGVLGAGAVRENIYQTTYDSLVKQGVAPDVAAAAAEAAQAYTTNPALIAAGAAAGVAAGRFGADEAIIAAGGGQVDDVARAASKGVIRSAAEGAAKEAFTEAPQEGLETRLGNEGAIGAGAEIDPNQGVLESAVKAGIMSAIPGAAGEAYSGVRARRADQPGGMRTAPMEGLADDEFTQTGRPAPPEPPSPGSESAQYRDEEPFRAPIAPQRRQTPAVDPVVAQIVLEAEILGGDGLKALMDTGMPRKRAEIALKAVRDSLGPKAPAAKGIDRKEDRKAAKQREEAENEDFRTAAASFEEDPLANVPHETPVPRRDATPEEVEAYLAEAQRRVKTARDEQLTEAEQTITRAQAQRNLEEQAYAGILGPPQRDRSAEVPAAKVEATRNFDDQAMAPALESARTARAQREEVEARGGPAFRLPALLAQAVESNSIKPLVDAGVPGSPSQLRKMLEGAKKVRGNDAVRNNAEREPLERLDGVPKAAGLGEIEGEPATGRGIGVADDRGQFVEVGDEARGIAEGMDAILGPADEGQAVQAGPKVEVDDPGVGSIPAETVGAGTPRDDAASTGRGLVSDAEEFSESHSGESVPPSEAETRALYDEIASRVEQIQREEPNLTHAIIAQRVNKEFGTDARLGRGREALSRRIVDEVLTGKGPKRAVKGTPKEDVPVKMAQSVDLERDFDETMDRIEGEAARRSEIGIAFDAAERGLRERFGPLDESAAPEPEDDLEARLQESVRDTRGDRAQGQAPGIGIAGEGALSEEVNAVAGEAQEGVGARVPEVSSQRPGDGEDGRLGGLADEGPSLRGERGARGVEMVVGPRGDAVADEAAQGPESVPPGSTKIEPTERVALAIKDNFRREPKEWTPVKHTDGAETGWFQTSTPPDMRGNGVTYYYNPDTSRAFKFEKGVQRTAAQAHAFAIDNATKERRPMREVPYSTPKTKQPKASEPPKAKETKAAPQTPEVAAEKVVDQIERVVDTQGVKSAKEVHERVMAALQEELAAAKKVSPFKEIVYRPDGTSGGKPKGWIGVDGKGFATLTFDGLHAIAPRKEIEVDLPKDRTQATVAPMVRLAVARELTPKAGSIRIQIPGDGTFTIARNIVAIEMTLDRIRRGGASMWKSVVGYKPGPPRAAPKSAAPKPAPPEEKAVEETKHDFSSTQANIPEPAREMVRVIGSLVNDSDLAGDGKETEPHVTVKYGTHTDDAEAIRKIMADEGPIQITFGELSTFPPSDSSDGAEVLKIDVDSADLRRLNKKISDALPHTDTFKYAPHVTVAYLKPGAAKKYIGRSHVLRGKTITLNSVVFSDKNGEQHEIPLQGKPDTATVPVERPAKAKQTGERADLIEKIIAAAAAGRPKLTIRERFELKATDGKWYRGSLPWGVRTVEPTERRSIGWGTDNESGVGVGRIMPTKEALEESLKEADERRDSEFRTALEAMPDERLKSQAEYWLKEKAPAAPKAPAKAEPAAKPPVHADSIAKLRAAIAEVDVAGLRKLLHPLNKNLRAMFTDATGLALPKGVKDTWDFLGKPETRTAIFTKGTVADRTFKQADEAAERKANETPEDRLRREVEETNSRMHGARAAVERADAARRKVENNVRDMNPNKGGAERAQLERARGAYEQAQEAYRAARRALVEATGDEAQKLIVRAGTYDAVDKTKMREIVAAAVNAHEDAQGLTKKEREEVIGKLASGELSYAWWHQISTDGLAKSIAVNVKALAVDHAVAAAVKKVKAMDGLEYRTGYKQSGANDILRDLKNASTVAQVADILKEAEAANEAGLEKKRQEDQKAAEEREAEEKRGESLKEPVPPEIVKEIGTLTKGEYEAMTNAMARDGAGVTTGSESTMGKLAKRGYVEPGQFAFTPAGKEFAAQVQRYEDRLKFGVPIAERPATKGTFMNATDKDTKMIASKFDGREFHSEGHWLVAGKLPEKRGSQPVKMNESFGTDPQNLFSKVLNPPKGFGEEVKPVAFYRGDYTSSYAAAGDDLIVMSNGGIFNGKYLDYILALHPGATMSAINADSQLNFRKDGKVVGVVMGIKGPPPAGALAIVEKDGEPKFARKPSAVAIPPEPRDLILQHNLTAANLIHADKMGGLAVPSMAVGKVDMPLEGFGEITLLGDKNLADPRESGMQVFSGDIYSPRYPTIRYKIRKASVIDEALKESNRAIGYSDWQDEAKKGGIDALSSGNPNMVWTFLKSKGIEPDVRLSGPSPERMAELRKVPGLEAFFGKPTYQNQENPEFRRLALEELKSRHEGLDEEERRLLRYEKLTDDQKRNVTRHLAYELEDAGTNKVDRGRSRDSLRDQLQALGLEREFETFRRDLFERAGSESKIFKGFTNAGNERTIPHTLENVVAEMKRNMKAGEGFSYGPGTVRGAVAPRLKSLQEIRNAKDRIVSKEAMAEVKEEVNTAFWEAAGHLPTGEGFGSGDRAVNFMVDVARMGFPRAEREYGWKLSDADRKAVGDFMTMLQTVPTEYFEAKLPRAVGIGEFSAAVVPNDADPKAIAILESHGIKIERYDRSDPADRKRAISDATQGEGMRFSRRGASTPFFSSLERAAEAMKQPMRGSEALRFLSTREGVKAAELKWTGLDDFLQKKAMERVTPHEIQEFLKANAVTVTEVEMGDQLNKYAVHANFGNPKGDWGVYRFIEGPNVDIESTPVSVHKTLEEAQAEQDRLEPPKAKGGLTKFSQYQLPGGTNYREVLLTLPTKSTPFRVEAAPTENAPNAFAIFDADGILKRFRSESEANRELQLLNDKLPNQFRSSHFDEPNIVAHVRMNDRTVDGKKVLFIEEIQSDWAQKGRREGIQKPDLAGARAFLAARGYSTEQFSDQVAEREAREMGWNRGVPSAPFIEKTEDWTALALKSILHKAAAEGYDSVAWTTGEQQAERYDLSKQIQAIVYDEVGNSDPVEYTVRIIDSNGVLAHEGDYEADKLEDIVGKDVAKRIVAGEGEENEIYGKVGAPKWSGRILKDENLKVGGEGMKAFYDKIVPQVANQIGKKFGARVGTTDVAVRDQTKSDVDGLPLRKVEVPNSSLRVHSLQITQQMRESAREGFPLFNRATTEADWEFYNGKRDEDRTDAKEAYKNGRPVVGAPAGVRVVDFEGDVDKAVLDEMARSSASLAAKIAPAVRMLQAHVPSLKFGGFTPAGNLHGVMVNGMVFVNHLATHQIALETVRAERITYPEAFARAMTDVLVHESAHYAEAGHGDAFLSELARIIDALGPMAMRAINRDFMRYASEEKHRAQNQRMYEKALPGWREGERRGREAAAAVRGDGDVRASPDVAERLHPRPRSDTGDSDGDGVEGGERQGSLFAPYGDQAEGVAAPAFVRGTDGRVAPGDPRRDENFRRWFGDSKVVDEDGKPLVVYRGEHGESKTPIHSRTPSSVTFSSRDAADYYATEPNVRGDAPVAERTIPAYLKIERPFINTPEDPFVTFGTVAKAIGRADAIALAIKNEAAIRGEQWEDGAFGNLATESVEDFLTRNPNGIKELSAEAFKLLDDEDFVAKLKKAGFDGAIHAGYGEFDDTEYRVFSPNQIKSATGNRGTFDPKNPDIRYSRKLPAPPEKLSVAAEGFLNDLAKRIRDVFTPVKVAQEAVERKVGKRWDVRLDRQLTGIPARADHTRGQAESMFIDPLIDLIRSKGLDFAKLGEYAQAMDEDPQRAAEIRAEVKAKLPAYEEARKRILDIQRIADDYKVKMGMASADEIADLRDTRGPDYVSQKEHPLIGAIQDLERTIIGAERNRTLNDLAEFIEAADEPALGSVSDGFEEGGVHFRREGAPMTINLPNAGLREAMEGLNEDQLDKLTQTVGGLTRWTSRVNTQLSPVFPIRNTGRDFGGAILFASILHGAPKGIAKSVAWEVMRNEFKAMRGVMEYLKAPEKKHPEGSWAAKVAEASRHGAIPGYLKQMSSIGKIRSELEESLKSKLSAKEHLKLNAAEARATLQDKSLDTIRKGAKLASLGTDAVSRATGFRAFSDFMGWLSNVSEMATRANYNAALIKNGMSPRQAADETRDLIDFNRKGSWTRNMQALLPFINPNIQGTARILDMVTSKDPNVKARAAKVIGAMTAAGFAYGMAMAAIGGDDDDDGIPDMDQLPDYQSARNVVLPAAGNLSPLLLPLPPGFNVPFFAGFMASKIARGTVKPGKAMASVAAQFAEAFTPVDSPFGVFKPLGEIATNKKFGGGPVSPTNFSEHRPDSTLAFKNTRTPYKAAAGGLNRLTGGDEVTKGAIDVSPDTLEHLGEALLGGTGRFFTRTADSVEALAKGQVPNYIPVVSDLTVDVERQRAARFYDQVRQIEETDYKRRGKEKSALVKELAERHPGVDFTRGTLPQLRKAMQGQAVSPERREWFQKEMERIDAASLKAKPVFDQAEKALKNLEKTMQDGPEKDAARREIYLRANRAYAAAVGGSRQ